MFRQIPRLQKRRGRPQTLRGGGIGGQMGGINRQVSRGGGGQLAGVQPQVQRGAGPPRSSGSVTTGFPTQAEQQQQGPLGGILAAKGAYDTTQDAFTGAKNLAEKAQGLYNNDSSVALRNVFSDSYIPTSGAAQSATDSITGGSTAERYFGGGAGSGAGVDSTGLTGLNAYPGVKDLGPGGLPYNQGLQNLQNQASTRIAEKVSNLSSGAGRTGSFVGPMYNPTNIAAGNTARFPGQVIEGAPTFNAGNQSVNAGGTAATAAGAQKAKAVTGLKATAPAAKGIDGFGAAAAGLGVGLSAYDIASNGATFGNVTGLAGSAALGAVALGASNAWNPVGWALLGASALDSVFEIF